MRARFLHRFVPLGRLRCGSLLLCLIVGCAAGDHGETPPTTPIATDPEGFRAHYQRGLELFRAGARRAAEIEMRRAVELAPNRPEPHLYLGRIAHAGNFFAAAEQEFRAALSIDPASIEARLGLVRTFERIGRADAAQEEIEWVLERFPEHTEALYYRGLLANRRGDSAAAAVDLERAVGRAPDMIEAHYQLGLARLHQEHFDAATDALRETIRLDRGHAGALQALARLLRLQGDDAAAARLETEFRTRQEGSGSGSHPQRDQAVAAYNAGRFEEARDRFAAIVAADPDNGQAIIFLGAAHLALEDLDAAEAELRRGLAAAPGNEMGHLEMGRLQALRGDLDGAVRSLRRAVELNPDLPLPHYFLTGIYQSQNRSVEAQRAWQEYQRLQAGAPGAVGLPAGPSPKRESY